ncbi:phytanoyl- dioxygenase [Chlorella sorokiniana]|uniref:Phytanoyl-dioxygenase n=1 Tax=Chlorella sorokiniana TaxID=3076 RepID=A0A2P6TS50_CHLSO|nr:phytanoyl- dioxygenase [Chlorella sorokiniana]|eukprot:PRW56893.1 phytanoyl- dioxygenase [Chlorella sorokiniana]
MPFPAEPVDWAAPASFYTGSDELVELADVHIKHSGLLLPVHSQVLATQAAVLRSLFRALREDAGSAGGGTRAIMEVCTGG